jgi:hydrogenase assembly chaperone HypC/HupF
MCQAIPRQVLQVADGRAEVLIGGRSTWLSTVALPDLAPGEYVLEYAGVALERVPEEEALELLDFLAAVDALFTEEEPLAERSG